MHGIVYNNHFGVENAAELVFGWKNFKWCSALQLAAWVTLLMFYFFFFWVSVYSTSCFIPRILSVKLLLILLLLLIINLSIISRQFSDPAVQKKSPLSPSSLSSSYMHSWDNGLLPSVGEKKERPVFSETGEDQVHLIINLQTPSDLCSTHPPGSNMCISLWEDSSAPLSPPACLSWLVWRSRADLWAQWIGPKWLGWFAKCNAWLRAGKCFLHDWWAGRVG